MTGLEKILKNIDEQAAVAAAGAIEQANTEAAGIVEAARLEAERARDHAVAAAQQKAGDILSSAQSAAALARRRALLAEKQTLIGGVIDAAQKELLALPEKEYFALVERLLEKYILPQNGEICFSQTDLNRLPTGYGIKLGLLATARHGGLKVNKEPRAIDGGFILVYRDDEADGDIEINCSFEAIFYAAREALLDKVSESLFS